LYDVNENDVVEFLLSIDIEDYFIKYNPNNTGDEIVFILFEEQFGKAKQAIEKIYWFHLTSVIEGTDFKEGLLPLGNSLNYVWDNLEKILINTPYLENIKSLRKNGVPSYDFMLKLDAELHGPYAILIRDMAFELGHEKYLKVPEIMEDILDGYRNKYSYDIRPIVEKSMKSCIVKFWSEKRIDHDCVKTAIYYLHTYLNKNAYSLYTNTCFDGYNEIIPFKQIDMIEYNVL
jgi:hypothetical protein